MKKNLDIRCKICDRVTPHFLHEATGTYHCSCCSTVNKKISIKKSNIEVEFVPDPELELTLNPETEETVVSETEENTESIVNTEDSESVETNIDL